MNLPLKLTTDQVIGLVQQIPPEEKREVLLALAEQAEANRAAHMDYAEAQLRRIYITKNAD